MSGPFGSSQWMYSSAAGFYPHTIDQSLRFEDGDSAMLDNSADLFASHGNLKTWTWSCWVKRANLGTNQTLWSCGANNNNRDYFGFDTNDNLIWIERISGTTKGQLVTVAKYRDVSAWYNVTVVRNTDNVATADDRLKIYVNGVIQEESITNHVDNNHEGMINRTLFQHNIGSRRRDANDLFFDGYMADVVFVDGSALGPDSFGELKDGIWVAKDVSGLTFGQNGFHLDFSDSSAIGNDVSGNDNDFAVSGLVAADVTEDTPTNNHSTWNPLVSKLNIALSEGNTVVNLDDNATGEADMVSTMVCPLGVDIYGEFKATAFHDGAADSGINIGIIEQGFDRTEQTNTIRQISGGVFYAGNGYLYTNSVQSGSAQATYTLNDIIGIKVDRTADEVKFYKNNVLQWTENIDATKQYHFGVDSGYTNSTRAISYRAFFTASSWTYTPEDNFLALCSASLPEPSIISGEDYFNSVLYTGNSGTQAITVGWQPDWVWMKARNHTYSHGLFDSVRGATKKIYSNSNVDEVTESGLTSFDADGFTLGSAAGTNNSGKTYVAWNWKAGTAVSGATTGSGTAKTYTGSVNTEAGFSIIKYVGNGTSGHTIPHNLGAVPKMIIAKNLDQEDDWAVYHNAIGSGNYLKLNTTADSTSAAQVWNDTTPTNSVFSVGSNHQTNATDENYIAYCFTDIEGFSKAGVYSGNSSTNGTYVHTNFKVSWLMVKVVSTGHSGSWYIWDDKRSPHNEMNDRLVADLSAIETADREVDFLSNGFKLRESNNAHNTSGREYIYLAFGSSPAKFSNAR